MTIINFGNSIGLLSILIRCVHIQCIIYFIISLSYSTICLYKKPPHDTWLNLTPISTQTLFGPSLPLHINLNGPSNSPLRMTLDGIYHPPLHMTVDRYYHPLLHITLDGPYHPPLHMTLDGPLPSTPAHDT